MLQKLLKEVVVLVIGKQSEGIADLLDTKKYVNEFIIAKKLGLTINQTRNILYKISDYGLVSSIRKKDKKKGWYTYFWKLEILRCLEFFRETLLKKMEQVASQIKSRETKDFYVCERCEREFTEENALYHDFTCNECGGVFTRKDNVKLLRELKKNYDKLQKQLKIVDEEIRKEKEKLEKVKIKERKKEERARKKIKTVKKKFKKIKKKKPKKKKKKKKIRRRIATKKIKRKFMKKKSKKIKRSKARKFSKKKKKAKKRK